MQNILNISLCAKTIAKIPHFLDLYRVPTYVF